MYFCANKKTTPMDIIQIKDKKFTISIRKEDIQKEVTRVANEINRDLAGKNPLFLSVLNGSFMFTADLMKHITNPNRKRALWAKPGCHFGFIKSRTH